MPRSRHLRRLPAVASARLFSDAGDVFICARCQADAKQLIEIQDSIWAKAAATSESDDGTHKAVDI